VFLYSFAILAIACCSFFGIAHLTGYHCLQESIFDIPSGTEAETSEDMCDNVMESGTDARYVAVGLLAIAFVLFSWLLCSAHATVNGMLEARECLCCGARYKCKRHNLVTIGPCWPFRCYVDKMRLWPLNAGNHAACRPQCCFLIPCASRKKGLRMFRSFRSPKGYDLIFLKSRRDPPCGFMCW
jgi:hypothetical protein